MNGLDRNIIYDKFLVIEGWAYRGKKLAEKDHMDLAGRSAERIWTEIKELVVLLKIDAS